MLCHKQKSPDCTTQQHDDFDSTSMRGSTCCLRFQEKRGKEDEVPVPSKAKEAVDFWLKESLLASNPSAPLFPSFGKNRETIEQRRLDRRSVLKLVEKRAKASGILKRVCCHSFRATAVAGSLRRQAGSPQARIDGVTHR